MQPRDKVAQTKCHLHEGIWPSLNASRPRYERNDDDNSTRHNYSSNQQLHRHHARLDSSHRHQQQRWSNRAPSQTCSFEAGAEMPQDTPPTHPLLEYTTVVIPIPDHCVELVELAWKNSMDTNRSASDFFYSRSIVLLRLASTRTLHFSFHHLERRICETS